MKLCSKDMINSAKDMFINKACANSFQKYYFKEAHNKRQSQKTWG